MTASFPSAVTVQETHSAVLLLAADRVYKVKKPVDLGFLDFTTRQAREAVCHREVELNRRLSPDVYLGVYDVLDEAGAPVEHAVVMRRLPEELCLRTLVLAGADVLPGLRDLARLLAVFHSAARSGPAVEDAGSLASLRRNWQQGLDQLAAFAGPVVPVLTYQRMRELADRYLDGRAPLWTRRRDLGRLRDGHGDLLAADVYLLPDGPRVLDCIEFDDALRCGDVLLDVAFLAMDLEDLGRPDLAAHFLQAYEEFSGQPQPGSLTHHYVAYRAMVRSKVACLRWEQGVQDAGNDARRLAELAVRHLDAAQVRLVLVGGLPGTGKSSLAAELADARGWTLLRSDVVRRQGLVAGQAARYDQAAVDATYATLLLRARAALALGESVVLDATWGDAAWRARAAQVAADTGSLLVELQCAAPAAVADERMRRRATAGVDVSEADPGVAVLLARRFAPWPSALHLDTTQPRERTVSDAQDRVHAAHA